MNNKTLITLIIIFFSFLLPSISAYYINDIYFTVPDTVYSSGERIEIIGYLYQANYSSNGSLVRGSSLLANATINFTIISNSTYNVTSNYTLNTSSTGAFYSLSNYYPSAIEIDAPLAAGNYYLRAEYRDPNNGTSFSQVEIAVVNQTLDSLKVSPNKANYNPSESVLVTLEAVRTIGDRSLGVSNVSINGTLQNSSKSVLSTFNCTTGNNGKCTTSLTAPSTYGSYIVEVGNYKAFSSFYVIPFSFNVYMKDELAKSLKNIYAVGEQASVEVSVTNASTSDLYSFYGYIADSSGNVVKIINSTQLNNNNSFTGSFLFSVDSLTFQYGAYAAYVTVNKTGDGSISAQTSFEVRDWALAIEKKSSISGFEYEYSAFPNRTLRFETSPTYRINGTVIPSLNASFFTIALKDRLNNVVTSTNVSWNATCGGNEGCYEFSLTSPTTAGQYNLYATLAHSGITQTKSQRINIISGVMSGQSTDSEGNIKELFGTNEYVYISLSSYNITVSQTNLSNAEVFLATYMNGSEISYTQVASFDLVNASNSAYEWAWNSSSQRIKLDVPKFGGLYSLSLFGDNRSFGAVTKFIVNPYDYCITSKDTAGQVTSGYYYVSQFKKTDTVYFDLKIVQANNPLGRATAQNGSGSGNSSSYGQGGACATDTTKQAVTNATITVSQVTNLESGAVESVNASQTNCISSDSSGGYTCTVKPLTKWDGGTNIVQFRVVAKDGTISTIYGKFESRAFYLYGYSSTWQNNPSSTISLNVQMYEAGRGWWSGGGSSGGLSGTITLKKVEYQGRDGEWIWPPISYNYTTNISSSISSGTGTLSLPASSAPGGAWKTGYYRAIIQGTTSSGDTDYGYAWFSVKLWDVYGQPIECTSGGCSYKNYFNSRENITLYIKISNAGSYNYGDMGGSGLGGNVTVSVKKIDDCRSWPCKELNSSTYVSNILNLNQSSGWYWNSNSLNSSGYLLRINTTTGTWNSGYYSVTLNVNNSDTGYAWFNTIAFYVETQPTNLSGSYVYSIKGNSPMFFNVTTTKSYKSGYWQGNNLIKYNASDYINTTVYDAVLRSWDQTTWQSKEFNYPESINITPLGVNGTGIINITYLNGSWPTGYYWGELMMNNSLGETSTGWLWFSVQPFRVQLSSNDYNIDSTQCLNATLSIYEPDWNNVALVSNYSIVEISETSWNGMSQTRTMYTNYTVSNLTNTAVGNITFCPNSGGWGSGSWGGYHSLNVLIRDNIQNDTQTGWLSFRSVPFRTQWGSIVGGSSKQTNANVQIPVNVTSYNTGQNTSGNLSSVYQWRYDNYRSTREDYVFSVGSCYSNVSGQCTVNGNQTVTVYAPSTGWKVGYNYLYTMWNKQNDASSSIEDWSGIYFDGREAYNGYFLSSDTNGNYKYDFSLNENLTVKIYVRDSNYDAININITSVSYAVQTGSCTSDWCRTYNTATWSLVGGGVQTSNGNAIIRVHAPAGGWTTKGNYYIKATISGSSGSATILDSNGISRVKDTNAPNITVSLPANNDTLTGRNVSFSWTTTENSQCNLYIANFNSFNLSYCSGALNSTNGTTTQQTINACNSTKYGYVGVYNYSIYASSNYYSAWDGTNYTWSSGSIGLSTGGTTHIYVVNTTLWPAQHYGTHITCSDEDWNWRNEDVTFKVNNTS